MPIYSASFLAAVGQTVAIYSYSYGFRPQMGPFTINLCAGANLCLSAIIDLAISSTLILSVRRHILGFNASTDSAIRRLVRTAAWSASYTTLCAVAAAALSVAWPVADARGANVFLAFAIPLTSLHPLALLSTLGARRPLGRAGAGDKDCTRPSAAGQLGRTLSRMTLSRKSSYGSHRSECGPAGCVVRVRTETVQVVEMGEDEEPGGRLKRERSRSSLSARWEGGCAGAPLGLLPAPGQVPGQARRPSVQFLEVPGAA